MPAEELRSPQLSANLVRALQQPLALDLTAAYAMMRDGCMCLVSQAVREGWTPDQLLSEIEGMIAPGPSSE